MKVNEGNKLQALVRLELSIRSQQGPAVLVTPGQCGVIWDIPTLDHVGSIRIRTWGLGIDRGQAVCEDGGRISMQEVEKIGHAHAAADFYSGVGCGGAIGLHRILRDNPGNMMPGIWPCCYGSGGLPPFEAMGTSLTEAWRRLTKYGTTTERWVRPCFGVTGIGGMPLWDVSTGETREVRFLRAPMEAWSLEDDGRVYQDAVAFRDSFHDWARLVHAKELVVCWPGPCRCGCVGGNDVARRAHLVPMLPTWHGQMAWLDGGNAVADHRACCAGMWLSDNHDYRDVPTDDHGEHDEDEDDNGLTRSTFRELMNPSEAESQALAKAAKMFGGGA